MGTARQRYGDGLLQKSSSSEIVDGQTDGRPVPQRQDAVAAVEIRRQSAAIRRTSTAGIRQAAGNVQEIFHYWNGNGPARSDGRVDSIQ